MRGTSLRLLSRLLLSHNYISVIYSDFGSLAEVWLFGYKALTKTDACWVVSCKDASLGVGAEDELTHRVRM